MDPLQAIGRPSPFVCPECHGGLWEVQDSRPTRYRCHTGHAFSERSLQHALVAASDEAGWSALRALQEWQMLLQHMAAHRHADGQTESLAAVEAALLRQLMETRPDPVE